MNGQHLYLVAIAAIVGCATGTSGASSTYAAPRSGNVLAAEQIAAFGVEGRTAYDLVARLRPKWLVVRGVQSLVGPSDSTEFALVMVDGHPAGRIGSLRDIQAYQVADIRYYDVGEAGGKFGGRGASGVIEVRLKSPSHQ
ncbi:MAG: hypothetical protein M3P26_11630 [Gemmatimonadota bacterium]|nr:hypothetical protein [Gemmatimonadota bacterium]